MLKATVTSIIPGRKYLIGMMWTERNYEISTRCQAQARPHAHVDERLPNTGLVADTNLPTKDASHQGVERQFALLFRPGIDQLRLERTILPSLYL